VDGVSIEPLTAADIPEVGDAMARNAAHLSRWSDWGEEIERPEEVRVQQLAEQDRPLTFGIRANGELIGCAGLIPVAPPRYSISYWVDSDWTGQGVATAAVAFLCLRALSLRAEDLYAGVAHGNAASTRVLFKNGFVEVEKFDTYTRFHRRLTP
jgi:RimJ/RimL family protein N-acetyltransferase